jgi:hypothetical protein
MSRFTPSILLSPAPSNPQSHPTFQAVKIFLAAFKIYPDFTAIDRNRFWFYLIGRNFFCINNGRGLKATAM